jgi:3-oxoacyl-[acyl-carrier-protein] synthase-3
MGRSLPAHRVDNDQVAARLGVDAAWIERRTGIRSRLHARGERLTDLAAEAAAAALEDAGVTAADVDLVLVATSTADDMLPNAAPLVAHALGCHAAAIDVGAACTGFVAALALASATIESGRTSVALVIGADVLSRHLDPYDRRTAGLFGDGAGAVVLARGAGSIGPVVLRSAGEHAELIAIPRGGVVRMEGHETFLVAVASLVESTLDACRAAEIEPADVDLFVYHQANRRILDAVAERLAVGSDRVLDTIAEVGNTSAASIPLALCTAAAEGRLEPGMRVLVGAVGAGFTYGAAVLEWGPGDE